MRSEDKVVTGIISYAHEGRRWCVLLLMRSKYCRFSTVAFSGR